MRNIVREISENCPECACDLERTVKYLYENGDIAPTSDYYREIWYFYIEALKITERPYRKKKARSLTLDHFKISSETFKNIRARFMKK